MVMSEGGAGSAGGSAFSVDTAEVERTGAALERVSLQVADGRRYGPVGGLGEASEMASAITRFCEAWYDPLEQWQASLSGFARIVAHTGRHIADEESARQAHWQRMGGQ